MLHRYVDECLEEELFLFPQDRFPDLPQRQLPLPTPGSPAHRFGSFPQPEDNDGDGPAYDWTLVEQLPHTSDDDNSDHGVSSAAVTSGSLGTTHSSSRRRCSQSPSQSPTAVRLPPFTSHRSQFPTVASSR